MILPKQIPYYYFLFLFCLFQNSIAQSFEEKNTLFESNDILNLKLTFCFDSIINNNFSEKRKYEAVLEYMGDNNVIKKSKLNISKRGHFRKSFGVCDFPPLRFNFSSMTDDSVFYGISKIKLVTHCQNSDTTFDQFVIMEYCIYQMYNILTQRSFNTRLTKIKYIDEGNKHLPMNRWGFFIENLSSLAKRINGKVLDIKYIYPVNTEQYYYILSSLFQYMIICQDWSVQLLHNVELIGIYPDLKPVIVPFDFDMSGILNIPYKSEVLDYKRGQEPRRVYLAQKTNRKDLYRVINRFLKVKPELYKLIDSNIYLSAASKMNFIKNLNDFYRIIENRPKLRKYIIRKR